MHLAMSNRKSLDVPKKQRRPLPYGEDMNEPSALVQDEPVDVERDVPDQENDPVERVESDSKAGPAIFEE